MTFAVLNSSIARAERSPRFPSGVSTSTSAPACVSPTSVSSFGSRTALPINIVPYVKADREAQTTRQEEGQPRQEAELRSRLAGGHLAVPPTVTLSE